MFRLVGYYPKRRVSRATWANPDVPFPAGDGVDEICSVSGCIAGGQEIYGEECSANEACGYDTPESARREAALDPRPFDLHAWKLLPVLFRDGHQEPLELPESEVDPLPEGYERLGYDAVELREGFSWGCSPLSCNGQAFRAAVNRYFLLDSADEAVNLARLFSDEKPEPGPYCVVEVWRESSTCVAG